MYVDIFNWAIRKKSTVHLRLTGSHMIHTKHHMNMFDPVDPLQTVIRLLLLTLPPFFKQERKSAAHRCAKQRWAVDWQHPSSVQWRWVLLLWLPLPINCNANQITHTRTHRSAYAVRAFQILWNSLTWQYGSICRGGFAVCSLGTNHFCRKTTFLTVKPLDFQSKIKKMLHLP